MPFINFLKNRKPITVEVGDNLMQSLLRTGLPVASSCNGQGICSKCRVRVVENPENLSAESKLELELRKKNQISSDHRISCQCSVNGDITVDTNYW